MDFIDFWLWSCKSYFKFITCQGCSGSPSWTAAYYGWERALSWAFPCHELLQSPSAPPALEQPTLMLWEVSEQSLTSSPPAAPCTAVPAASACQRQPMPRCTVEEGRRGAVPDRRQAAAWWPQLGGWQAPPSHPTSSPALLTHKLWSCPLCCYGKPENLKQMQGFARVYRQPGSNNSGRYKLLLSS